MRRLTAWIGGTAVGVAAYRLLRRRPEAAPEPEPTAPEADDRAEELRVKLAKSRVAEPSAETVVEEPTPAEPVAQEEPAADPEQEPESPEERRRRVHQEGRSALDDMKSE